LESGKQADMGIDAFGAADTTAALRANPETTDGLLCIEGSAHRIRLVLLCWTASGCFDRPERLPEAV